MADRDHDRLDEILLKLDKLTEQQAATHLELREFRAAQAVTCANASAQRTEHHRSLYGNGKPGLVSEVQDIKGAVERIETAQSEVPAGGVSRSEAYGVGAAVITAVEAIKAFLHLS
jgi:hypothetical protein